jgi:hypothetical protein
MLAWEKVCPNQLSFGPCSYFFYEVGEVLSPCVFVFINARFTLVSTITWGPLVISPL